MRDRTIPLVDVRAQYEAYKNEFDDAVSGVLAKSAFIGGDDHTAFAREFAEFCGGGSVALVGNGTDALELLLIEKLGQGDGSEEIITASHTFIATSEAIGRAGYRPVFVDIEPTTYLMKLDAVEAAIGPATKAIVAVHLYGQMMNMPALQSIAAKHGIAVFEDAAQAHGATFAGESPGARSDGATFSFYPGKNLGAWGDGGAVFSKDASLIRRINKLANHGRSEKYLHEFEGRNSRLDGLQAAVLRVKLRHLVDWTERRRAIARHYDTLLKDDNRIVRPTIDSLAEAVHHLYVVRVVDRDATLSRLKEQGIGAGVHYPVPLHEQPAYRHLGIAPGDLPETSKAAKEILSLPIYPEMTDNDVEEVVSTLKTCL